MESVQTLGLRYREKAVSSLIRSVEHKPGLIVLLLRYALPFVLLADEPTGTLDTTTSYEIMALFKAINSSGITIAVVTHESDIAAKTERIIRMKDGVISEQ